MAIKTSNTLLTKKVITPNKSRTILIEKILDTLTGLKSDFTELKTLNENARYTNNSL